MASKLDALKKQAPTLAVEASGPWDRVPALAGFREVAQALVGGDFGKTDIAVVDL